MSHSKVPRSGVREAKAMRLDERMRGMEEKLKRLERSFSTFVERQNSDTSNRKGHSKNLEDRMGKLEVSVKRALETVFPKVDSLVTHLEQHHLSGTRMTSSASNPPTPASISCDVVSSPLVRDSFSFCEPSSLSSIQTSVPSVEISSWSTDSSLCISSPNFTPKSSCGPLPDLLQKTIVEGSLADTLPDHPLKFEVPVPGARPPSGDSNPAGAASNFAPRRAGRLAKSQKKLKKALLKAAEKGKVEAVRALLRSGVDVNARDIHGGTALHCASASGRANLAALLLRSGADVLYRDVVGQTALHYAAFDCSGRCAELLIAQGAPVDSRNAPGRTPLHLAASWGNEPTVRALLAAGADTNARDNWGKTPRALAVEDCVRQLFRR